jgi:hypothetical protein
MPEPSVSKSKAQPFREEGQSNGDTLKMHPIVGSTETLGYSVRYAFWGPDIYSAAMFANVYWMVYVEERQPISISG